MDVEELLAKAKKPAADAMKLHPFYRGKIETALKCTVHSFQDFAIWYTPGVAAPCKAIQANPELVYEYTNKWNTVIVVSDGTRVLGLGDIGPKAGLPVMEGKALLYKYLGGVDGIPIMLDTKDPDAIINTVLMLQPGFGGVNLEDISAPRCFYIEERLKQETDIPIFHDDQHGTAVVVLAGLMNACKLTGRNLKSMSIVVNGAGASAIAVSKLLISVGVGDVILCDTSGTIYAGREKNMNWIKQAMAQITNAENVRGTLADAVRGRDIFLGLSVAGALKPDMIRSMNQAPIVFGLANPPPELFPAEAKLAGAALVATGPSDLPNQVNNSMAYPVNLRAAVVTRLRLINDEMKIAAAHAIASIVTDTELNADYIMPKGMDFRVAPKVAAAVAKVAMESGEARQTVDVAAVEARCRAFVYEGQV